MTLPTIHPPIAPEEIDALQRVFDRLREERLLDRQSPAALELAQMVIRLHFDGIDCEETLLDAIRSATA